MVKHPNPRERRERLCQMHSTLRSADSLRPDEAFDELVKLYRVWAALGPVALDDRTQQRFEINLSEIARDAVVPPLWSLLSSIGTTIGPDLFQELADVGVRSGLGQYFTPAPVAEAMALYVQPKQGESWLDPFVGSGLLLGATALAATGPVRLFGSDLDRRVLRLATLEAKLRHPESHLSTARVSALEAARGVLGALEAPREGVDGIVTNPPFGAVDLSGGGGDDFELRQRRRTPLEVLALEQCLRLLRDGGRLAIVLPQSVLSNRRLERVRRYLRQHSRIDGILSLPGETFAMYEGVGKASVLFATKSLRTTAIWFGRARSVGWDATGRPHGHEDVRATARRMRAREASPGVAEPRRASAAMDRNLTAEWQLRSLSDGFPLGELADQIFVGKTPGRAQYISKAEESAIRVLKVADLTGHGVDWSDGERSYARFSRVPLDRLLKVGDIVLTAAAHHPRYIAAKVDVIDTVPASWETRCLPAGEILVIRLRSGVLEPHALLLWLRSPEGRGALQACVTGQTAHLHPHYVAEVRVPRKLTTLDLSAATSRLTESIRARRTFEALEAEASAEFGRLLSYSLAQSEAA